jgi:hypothetical protein
MGGRILDFRIEDKISNIRDTLQKLTASAKKEEQPLNRYLERGRDVNRTLDYELSSNEEPSYRDEERPFTKAPFQSGNRTLEKAALFKENYYKNSYSVDDLKQAHFERETESLESPQFNPEGDNESMKKSFVSDYIEYEEQRPRWADEKGDLTSSVHDPPGDRPSELGDRVEDPGGSSVYKRSIDLQRDKKRMEGLSSQEWEINLLLEYEKEKVHQLELKLQRKDQEVQELIEVRNNLTFQLESSQQQLRESNLRKDTEICRLEEQISKQAIERQEQERKIGKLIQELEDQTIANREHYRKYVEKHHKSLDEVKLSAEKMEQKVSELEKQKIKLYDENTQLSHKLISTQKEMEQLERQAIALRDELRSLKDKDSNSSSEVLELKRDRIKILRELEELQKLNLSLKDEAEKYRNENRILEERLELKEGIRNREIEDENRSYEVNSEIRARNIKLEDEIHNLKTELLALKDELKVRPTKRALLESEKRVEELEAVILDLQKNRVISSSFDHQDIDKSPRYRTRSTGKDKRKPNPKKDKEVCTLSQAALKRLITELMKEFNVETTSAIITCIKDQQKQVKSHTKWKDFIDKITSLVIECSPPGTFDKTPTLKRIWRWIRRLIEEYLYIKKEQEMSNNYRNLLLSIAKDLNTAYPEDLPSAISKLRLELLDHKDFLERLKQVLWLGNCNTDPRVSMRDIEEEIKRKARV